MCLLGRRAVAGIGWKEVGGGRSHRMASPGCIYTPMSHTNTIASGRRPRGKFLCDQQTRRTRSRQLAFSSSSRIPTTSGHVVRDRTLPRGRHSLRPKLDAPLPLSTRIAAMTCCGAVVIGQLGALDELCKPTPRAHHRFFRS